MKSLEKLKQQREVTEDLKNVVKTMKTLAAVNIRQYQRAVESLEFYKKTIEMGFHILIKNQPERFISKRREKRDNVGAIVFGSERGMCGQFNELVVNFTINKLDELFGSAIEKKILAIGERAKSIFDSYSQEVENISLPTSLSEFVSVIQRILQFIERWQFLDNVNQIILFHNEPTSAAGFSQNHVFLSPMDLDWLQSLKNKKWPSNRLPYFTMDQEILLSSIVKQYFFIYLYRSMAESLASENASRLAAMQAAERNIEEKLEEITAKYNRQRQESITSELLDVVSGFEAITESHRM